MIWEALHPAVKTDTVSDLTDESNTTPGAYLESAINFQVGQAVPPENYKVGNKCPPPQTQGFAAATAAATGQTKRTTNRALASVNTLGLEALDKKGVGEHGLKI